MTTFSDYLLSLIRGAKGRFRSDYTSFEVVLKQLQFLYDLCVASEQLLLDAAGGAQAKEDVFSRVLGTYYQIHFEEEKGEIYVLAADLASAGISVGKTAPHPLALGLIGTQYYLIKHLHPVCLLGYMAIQEADPTSIEVVEKLEAAYGQELFRFIRLHATRDLEHGKDLRAVLDRVPESLRHLVIESTENALAYLGSFYGTR